MKKASRTISGVTPIAVMAKPMVCPGECVFCPTYPDAPKSYTSESPAVLRAIEYGYDPKKQVESRINTLTEMGHPADKVELIVMGGTFLAYQEDYQYSFIKGCYDGLNGTISTDLEQAKNINENAEHRCTGLCIETRPDWCTEKLVKRMLDFGATRVELGVQTIDDDIFNIVRRGHKTAEVITATNLLKEYGFKVYYHWMPGLPGSNPEHDLEMSAELFSNPDFKPDGLKLYPTLIVANTEIYDWYIRGQYQPYSSETITELVMSIKRIIPPYVRIPRVMRDIPSKYILAGCKDLALRGSLKKKMAAANMMCRCIRCREYGHRLRDGWKVGIPALKRLDYDASGGKEIFLTYEDDNETLFGLLRLRKSYHRDTNVAMIREIHVFGSEVPIGKQQEGTAQHSGIGGSLLWEAEQIAINELAAHKIVIISGVGARNYFRSEFGYQLEGPYMVKKLN